MLRLLPPIRSISVMGCVQDLRSPVQVKFLVKKRSAAVSTTPRGDQGVRFLYISWSWLMANFTVKDRLINPPLKLHSLLWVFGKRFFISTFYHGGYLIKIELFMHSAINNLTLAPPFFGCTDNTKQPNPSKFGKWYVNSFIFWQDNCCLTNTASAWAWAPTPEGLRSINKNKSWSKIES